MTETMNEIRKRKHGAEADLSYALEIFGDELAEREGYKSLDGMSAIYFYLIHKFHWLPRDVMSMSAEHIRFVLSEELAGWTQPPSAPV